MLKKWLSILLALALMVSLIPAAAAEGIRIVDEPEDEITIIEPAAAELDPNAPETVVGLIVDGPVDNQDFNQLCYEAAYDYCQAQGVTFKLFTTEDYDSAIVDEAVAAGCNMLIVCGFMFTDMLRDCAPEYPDVKFIGLDVGEGDLAGEDEDYEIPANVALHTYKEEQAGYLAGYAAVKLGYTKLGFLGGPDFIPSILRYGYGFVQGAEAAADLYDDVTVFYTYAGQFFGEDWITEAMDVWVEQGIQAIFACGGGIWTSAADAAARGDAKIICCDMDMFPEGGLCATSAIKNLPASIRSEIGAVIAGTFVGGQEKNLGVVSDDPDENFVGIGPSTQFDENFTEEDYRALLAQIVEGDLEISDDIDAQPTDFAVNSRVVMKDLHAEPGEGLAINEENFPDPAFRSFVLFRLDPNADGVLTDEELAKVFRFNCDNRGIASLEGVEHFPELDYLSCEGNNLEAVDLSHNPKLEVLSLANNALTELDVSVFPELNTLYVCENPMETLDVTMNEKLVYLYAYDMELTSLDVSHNPLLEELLCYGNQIEELDIHLCPILLAYALEEEPVVNPEGFPEGVVGYYFLDYGDSSYYALMVDESTELITAEQPAYPITGWCGDELTWSLSEDGVLTITGAGDMWTFGPGAFMPSWNSYKAQIVSLDMQGGTSIGSFAFARCEALETIALPEGLETIGSMAFGDCTKLAEVTIPEGVTEIKAGAFNCCTALTKLELPDTLTSIAYASFLGCTALPEVTIPASVTSIDGAVFAECGSLSEVTFAGSAPAIGQTCFLFVTATAYYPAGDETWTEDVMKNYGGHITWVPYGEQPFVAPPLFLDGMSTYGVNLGWPAMDAAERYELQRKAGGDWVTIMSGPAFGFVDADVDMGQTYFYRVRAFNGTDWTDWSNEVEAFFNPFSDVSGKKTIEYVAWAFNNGIVNGTSSTTFTPDDPCTRIQFIMMLWKMHGSPVVGGKNPFEDISGKKTTNAILWALSAGVINSGKTFDPNGNISRVQIVMILWKLAGSPEVTGENPFVDVSGKKTTKAVLWAYQNGITKGTDKTHFAPDDDCTRVQLVVFLYKYNGIYHVI